MAAGVPLLQLPTAQAGWQNVPNPSQQEVFTILMAHPVVIREKYQDSHGSFTSISDAGLQLLGVFRGGGTLGDVLLDVTLQCHRNAVLVFLKFKDRLRGICSHNTKINQHTCVGSAGPQPWMLS